MTTEFSLDQMNNIGSGVDLAEVPPINQKRMLAFINEFLINTVSLLNDFYQSCEFRLQKFDLKMQKLEAELCILETKLKSIPGLEIDIPVTAPTVELPQPQTEPITPDLHTQSDDLPITSNQPSEDVEGESESVEIPKTSNPELEKYHKMLRFGVPAGAVKGKMHFDGIDPSLLDCT